MPAKIAGNNSKPYMYLPVFRDVDDGQCNKKERKIERKEDKMTGNRRVVRNLGPTMQNSREGSLPLFLIVQKILEGEDPEPVTDICLHHL